MDASGHSQERTQHLDKKSSRRCDSTLENELQPKPRCNMCGFDKKLVNHCTARKWTWPVLAVSIWHVRTKFDQRAFIPQYIKCIVLLAGTTNVTSDWAIGGVFRHLVSRHASDMVHETANVKPHKSKPLSPGICAVETAPTTADPSSRQPHIRVPPTLRSRTAVTCKNLLRRKKWQTSLKRTRR